nr:MAG TPA: hypothetical protein [Caudoviricetes sp.]
MTPDSIPLHLGRLAQEITSDTGIPATINPNRVDNDAR